MMTILTRLVLAVLLAVGLAATSRAELIENGDFSEGVNYWSVRVSPHHGDPDPVFALVDGGLEANKLHRTKAGYVNISQAVDIRQGKRYKLSYEIRGAASGIYRVSIQHLMKGRHYVSPQATPSPSWESFAAEFTGKYDTDKYWFEEWRAATKDNELVKGRGTPRGKLAEIERVGRDDPPTRSVLYFSLGDLKGSFAVRNVSIIELD